MEVWNPSAAPTRVLKSGGRLPQSGTLRESRSAPTPQSVQTDLQALSIQGRLINPQNTGRFGEA
jgi:hypothetical protein